MLDRAIGILGVALALIFGLWSLAPEGWPKMPPWLTLGGLAIGIFLVGVATGLIFSEQQAPEKKQNSFTYDDVPPHIIVSKKKFQNERILLDGHGYRECVFENVTLVFNGTEPFELTRNTFLGKTVVTSDNGAISGTIGLLRAMGTIPASVEFRNDSGSIFDPPSPPSAH
jgi:hypothetical protein